MSPVFNLKEVFLADKLTRIFGRISDIKMVWYPAGRISGAALLYKHDDVAGPGAPMGGGGDRQVPRGQSG